MNSFYTDEVDNSPLLSELAVFKENYALLCNTITDIIDPLMKYFVEEKLIATEETATASEKLRIILLKISDSLGTNDTRGFRMMLKIMKEHGGKGTQDLSDHIMNRLKVSSDSVSHICDASRQSIQHKGVFIIRIIIQLVDLMFVHTYVRSYI